MSIRLEDAPGGSSFAHLTEDEINEQVVIDWPLVFDDGGLGPAMRVGTDIDDSGIAIGGTEAGDGFVAVYADGSMWAVENGDWSGGYIGFYPAGQLEIASAAGVAALTPAGAGIWAVGTVDGGYYNGGGIRLRSPDGLTTKTVRLSDAGALELVA